MQMGPLTDFQLPGKIRQNLPFLANLQLSDKIRLLGRKDRGRVYQDPFTLTDP